jgi:hypothetical protein
MSTQYRLVQSGKTARGGCSAGQGSSEPVGPRIYFFFIYLPKDKNFMHEEVRSKLNSGNAYLVRHQINPNVKSKHF